MRPVFFSFVLVLCFTGLVCLQGQTPIAPQIHVDSCRIQSGAAHLDHNEFEASLVVRFRNMSTERLTRIVWRAKYASQWLTFVDEGDFAPAVQIDHALILHHRTKGSWAGRRLLFQNYTSTDEPENCRAIGTLSQSGETWTAAQPSPPFVPPTTPPKGSEPVPAAIDNPSHDPIGVFTCRYDLAGDDDRVNLFVRFRNLAPQTLDKVIFRVPYGTGAFDFISAGSYASGITIEKALSTGAPRVHSLGNVESLEGPDNCSVVSARYVDGTLWQNPGMPQALPPFPTPPPNAIWSGSTSPYFQSAGFMHFTNTANYLDDQLATPAP